MKSKTVLNSIDRWFQAHPNIGDSGFRLWWCTIVAFATTLLMLEISVLVTNGFEPTRNTIFAVMVMAISIAIYADDLRITLHSTHIGISLALLVYGFSSAMLLTPLAALMVELALFIMRLVPMGIVYATRFINPAATD